MVLSADPKWSQQETVAIDSDELNSEARGCSVMYQALNHESDVSDPERLPTEPSNIRRLRSRALMVGMNTHQASPIQSAGCCVDPTISDALMSVECRVAVAVFRSFYLGGNGYSYGIFVLGFIKICKCNSPRTDAVCGLVSSRMTYFGF